MTLFSPNNRLYVRKRLDKAHLKCTIYFPTIISFIHPSVLLEQIIGENYG